MALEHRGAGNTADSRTPPPPRQGARGAGFRSSGVLHPGPQAFTCSRASDRQMDASRRGQRRPCRARAPSALSAEDLGLLWNYSLGVSVPAKIEELCGGLQAWPIHRTCLDSPKSLGLTSFFLDSWSLGLPSIAREGARFVYSPLNSLVSPEWRCCGEKLQVTLGKKCSQHCFPLPKDRLGDP